MKVLVLYAHPVPDSYCARLRGRVVDTLVDKGHTVEVIDLNEEEFTAALSSEEWQGAGPDRALERHHHALLAADALVFVYPTWWGGQPAILKGWFDRVLVDGVAYHLPPGGNRIRPRLLNIRRCAVVTTHGSSKLVNSLQGEPGKRTVRRGIRYLFHPLCRSHWLAYYGMDTATATDLDGFADRVERAFREW